MSPPLAVAIASYGRRPFELLDGIVRRAGHHPVVYIVSRSMRPATHSNPEFVSAIAEVVDSLPAGMDLLLPGRAGGLTRQLAGYGLDLLIVFGFNWKLPPAVLSVPRLGALNIHPSTLPKYRGPSPVLWAVRNGDTHFSVTVHRMTDGIDAGPIIATSAPIPLADRVTHELIWSGIASALPDSLADAIERLSLGEPGEPQDDSQATYAGFPPEDWFVLDWTQPRTRIHHQLRVLTLLRPGEGVTTVLGGQRLQVRASSLEPTADGRAVACGDGPLWLTDWEQS